MSSGNDGRNIDPALGVLEGEGSQQLSTLRERQSREAGELVPIDGSPTYYNRPVIKDPEWI